MVLSEPQAASVLSVTDENSASQTGWSASCGMVATLSTFARSGLAGCQRHHHKQPLVEKIAIVRRVWTPLHSAASACDWRGTTAPKSDRDRSHDKRVLPSCRFGNPHGVFSAPSTTCLNLMMQRCLAHPVTRVSLRNPDLLSWNVATHQSGHRRPFVACHAGPPCT